MTEESTLWDERLRLVEQLGGRWYSKAAGVYVIAVDVVRMRDQWLAIVNRAGVVDSVPRCIPVEVLRKEFERVA